MSSNKKDIIKNGLTTKEFNRIANGTHPGLNTSTHKLFSIHNNIDANKITKHNLINQLENLRDDSNGNNSKREIKMINEIIKRIK